ncbi:TPA: hypothetical protein ACPVWX_004781, partial [Vibrio parahaemolyticus]
TLGIFHSIVGFCVYGGMVGFRGCVAHTLMRRYVNSAHYRLVFVFNQITEVHMNLSQIKTLLSKGEIKSNEVNPIIDSLAVSD